MPERRTREAVELAHLGEFELSTGSRTFTPDDFAGAIAHANHGAAPRIKLGHEDPRFIEASGSPAFGTVRNMRVSPDGEKLIGDLSGIPAWLDDQLDDAYPGRSIEARGRGDSFRLTGLALLGSTWPGIDTLADLQTALAAAAPAEDTEDVIRAASALGALATTAPATERDTPPHPAANPEGGVHMDPKQLRESIGLAEDASAEQVTARLEDLKARMDQAAIDALIAEKVEAALEEERTAVAASGPSVPEGMQLIDGEVLDSIKASAKRADDLHADAQKRERDEFIAASMRARKFGPAQRDKIAEEYDRNPDGTKALVALMASAGPPVDELGTADEDDSDPVAAAAQLDDDGLLPEELSILTPTERAARRAHA